MTINLVNRFLPILLLLSLMNLDTPGYASNKLSDGARCKIQGKIVVQNNLTFKCKKIKGKLNWKTIHTRSTENSKPIADPIMISMQNIVESLKTSDNKSTVTSLIIAEGGENGAYQDAITSMLPATIETMLQISEIHPYSKIYLLIGRSQEWLKNQRNYVCGNENPFDVVAAVSSPCTKDTSAGLIEINLPGVVTEKYLQADSRIDLRNYEVSLVTKERIRNLMPHEYYHFWQSKLQIKSAPSWFVEGAAQVFSLLVRSKIDKSNRTYSQIKDSWFTPEEVIWSQQRCRSSIAEVTFSMESQCQYLQGIIPVEVLLTKYGGLNTLRKLMQANSQKPFEDAFGDIVGISLTDFYRVVDDYAIIQGWNSGR